DAAHRKADDAELADGRADAAQVQPDHEGASNARPGHAGDDEREVLSAAGEQDEGPYRTGPAITRQLPPPLTARTVTSCPARAAILAHAAGMAGPGARARPHS